MKINLEIIFENCGISYSSALVDKFNAILAETFGEHFDIQHSLRPEKKVLFGYIGLSRSYINASNLERLIRATKKIAQLVKPERVIGDYEQTIDSLYEKKNSLFWLNVFNPLQAKKIGKEKLLSAPVYKAEELEDSAILLILNDDPWSCGDEIREKVRRHLFG